MRERAPDLTYERWRDFAAPYAERLLVLLENEQTTWDEHERRCAAARVARASGLAVADPAAPRLTFRYARALSALPESERAKIVAAKDTHLHPMPVAVSMRDHRGRVRSLSKSVTGEQIGLWIMGEAVQRGMACDFETAYELWFVFADLLLQEADIGAVVAKLHPERLGRLQRLDTDEERQLNIDLARKERKRVKTKLRAFGYGAA
jgi:hypothetical protein